MHVVSVLIPRSFSFVFVFFRVSVPHRGVFPRLLQFFSPGLYVDIFEPNWVQWGHPLMTWQAALRSPCSGAILMLMASCVVYQHLRQPPPFKKGVLWPYMLMPVRLIWSCEGRDTQSPPGVAY